LNHTDAKWTIVLMAFLLSAQLSFGQYPPPAGYPGTTAMYKDSSAFRAWASGCTIEVGYINFVDTTVTYLDNNKASYGFPEDATGPPDNFVVSLGDRGVATLTLPAPVYDSSGPDFAIFENSFSNEFLELGFVEVSSNGTDFVRFPAVSLTPESPQIATYGSLDATKIHNFAGKYRVFYGTPFDLNDLKDSLSVDISAVTHIRIIDVGGCVLPGYQAFDSQGHIINDPWPTPFNTGGVDLDAVGLIHIDPQAIPVRMQTTPFHIFPNPAQSVVYIDYTLHSEVQLTVISSLGKIFFPDQPITQSSQLNISDYPPGLYIARFTLEDGTIFQSKIIKQ